MSLLPGAASQPPEESGGDGSAAAAAPVASAAAAAAVARPVMGGALMLQPDEEQSHGLGRPQKRAKCAEEETTSKYSSLIAECQKWAFGPNDSYHKTTRKLPRWFLFAEPATRVVSPSDPKATLCKKLCCVLGDINPDSATFWDYSDPGNAVKFKGVELLQKKWDYQDKKIKILKKVVDVCVSQSKTFPLLHRGLLGDF
jgi:hypothetical protein